MKIAHLTSAHTRYDVRIFKKQCISLQKSGYDVTLFVADGKGEEIVNGVEILDVGKFHNRYRRIFSAPKKILRHVLSSGFEVCHIHDPELLSIALRLERRGIKVVYDIHEDLPKQIMLKNWIPKGLRYSISRLFSLYENFVSKRIHALIVPQPYMLENYREINPCTYLVENFVIIDEGISTPSQLNKKEKICFHAGRLTEDRGLYNMIRSFNHPTILSKLVLAGTCEEYVEKELHQLKHENINFLGALPFESIKNLYSQSDFGIILYNNVGQYHLSYAIKLFEYMSYGLPVIMPNFGEWNSFNEENKCGINVDPTNVEEVREAIDLLSNNLEIAKKLGGNGLNAVKDKYNWQKAESKLILLYKKMESNN